jgi:A/G-specific adenine glycosylase
VKHAQRALLEWYEGYGRKHLPWRMVRDPYYTLVSEFMLQQTQVDRVVPKFQSFVCLFPNVMSLAKASRADVLRAWQGLGYNSRAVRLHQLANEVAERFEGRIPRDPALLASLPGIGPYTAAAIRAFAFDEDAAPVDTNVRRIVHRLCYGVEHPPLATARELDQRAQSIVATGRSHDWNSALMDLGSSICTARAPKCLVCPLQRDCAAAPIDGAALEERRTRRRAQNAIPFERTTRYARGRIVDRLRALPPGARISLLDLHHDLGPIIPERSLTDVKDLIADLARDGVVSYNKETVALAE